MILICWFAAQKTFLIIINAENSCAAENFGGNRYTFYFSGFFDERKSSKVQHLSEIEIFCNIISVFTFTFDLLNAFLLNKCIPILLNKSVFTYD